MTLEELSKISNPKEVYRKFKENGYDEYTNIYVSMSNYYINLTIKN